MFRKLKIAPRLIALIATQAVILLAVSALALTNLRFALDTTGFLNDVVAEGAEIAALSDSVRSDLVGTVHALNIGTITWPEGKEILEAAREDFRSGWTEFLADLDPAERELVDHALAPHAAGVSAAFDQVIPIAEAQSRSRLALFVSNDLEYLVGPFLDGLVASTSLQQVEAAEVVQASVATGERFLSWSVGVAVVGVLLAIVLGVAIFRSISGPLGAIAEAVRGVAGGDFSARTAVTGSDELGELGTTFDRMLDERVTNLSRAQAENERLNESVIGLLEAVSKLSQRDLRVQVPVTEDVTGPVADALNLLTGETAKVLHGVRDISAEVASTSKAVKSQSDRVIQVAQQEKLAVEATAADLSHASENMVRIAKLAEACAQAADKAIASTQTAMESVNSTAGGINGIRDTIRETEKRIKRLGERSQEISGVVDLINTIAERTHILALNASMHAASAGEAGRGFAVVADEVQRLAENARDATSQISNLVKNIQVETGETVTTMNDVISQVVAGSGLAEQAGTQMQATQKSTAELVQMVQKIADGSQQQARTSVKLRQRAQIIQRSTQDTSEKLIEQSAYTEILEAAARRLVDAVAVFVLPERAAAPSAPRPAVTIPATALPGADTEVLEERPLAANG